MAATDALYAPAHLLCYCLDEVYISLRYSQREGIGHLLGYCHCCHISCFCVSDCEDTTFFRISKPPWGQNFKKFKAKSAVFAPERAKKPRP